MAAVSVRSFDFGRGAVGVDIADLLRGEAGIAQGHAHGARGAFGGGLGNVAGVGGHAEADDLGDGLGAAGERGLERLEHQHGAPSPSTRPLRSAEKGRQVSLLMTRMASQALRLPK